MLLRYLELLNRGLVPQNLPGGTSVGWPRPRVPQMRPDLPGWPIGRPVGLLEAMDEDDKPPGLLGMVGDSDARSRRSLPAADESALPSDQLAQTAPGVAPDSPGSADVPPIPAYKSKSVRKADWTAFHRSLGRLQGIGPNALSAFGRTFAEEGGMTPNASSGAVAGIMPVTFDELNRSGRIPELANIASVGQLTPELAALIYADIANQRLRTVGGIAALEQINRAASEALYDSLFQHGGAGGTGFIQEAVNEIIDGLPETERRRLAVGRLTLDRKMGPGTFGALKALVQDSPETAARLLGALADARSKPVKGKPRAAGELARFGRHREGRSQPPASLAGR